MIDIFDISGTKITSSDVLNDLLVTRDCQHIEELMKSNYVKLSWGDTKRYELPVGAYIIPFPNETNPYIPNDTRYPIKYKLFSPYVPEAKNSADYEYEPEFQHPIMWLANLPLMFITGNITTWAEALKKTTWGYTGSATQIASFIVNCINWIAAHDTAFGNTFGTGWVAMVDTNLAPNATVSFDSVDIMSGASAIAQAFDCEFHFDFARKQFRLGEIRYGTEVTLQTDVNVGVASVNRTKTDYHNAFLIKGGTKNLSQPTDTGENLQLTERLTLDPTTYPDSTIYTDNAGNIITREQFVALGVPALMEELIFDDVYPKLDLYLYNVRERKCWLLVEGHRIEDPNGELDPTDNKRYKAYSKWYTRLAYPIYTVDAQGNRTISSWADYHATEDKIIEGQTLQITFLPNLESGAMTSLLIGQGDFDAVYFAEQTHEWEEDDIDPNGFTAEAGDYRIVQKEVSGLIIPTTSSGGIYPQGGLTPAITNNKSTLLNIVVDDTYKVEARQDLEMVAKRKVSLLRSDLNNYNLPSNPVYFEANNTKLHIGQAVIYNDGQTTPYTLSTHVLKIVTQLDYPFVQEITVGNQKVKGDISTMKEQIQTILSGGVGGSGSIDERQITTLIQTIGSQYFLSKVANDTAKGELTFEQKQILLQGLQVGGSFIPGILGEGGVLRKRAEDGKVELEVDILYARMKAYFDTVEVREYQHTGGNRIASDAGNRMTRVEWYDANNQVLEQTSANLSSVAYFRCYFRASDGEDTVRNNWVVGDLAYCHVTSIANSSDNPEQKGANQKHLWRLVIGRNADNVLTADGEAYIDLSNRSTETISSESYAGYQSGSDAPAAQDDIIQLGNVNDTTRQGAIVEFVTGTDAPSYQIYQGIGQKVGSDASSIYSLTSKNQITIGYNTATGKADMKVFGDAYIGARDRSTFIEYKQDDGTQQHAPVLNIKAHVEFTNTDQELNALVQNHQPQTQAAIAALIQETEDLQAQIDGAIESYFMTGAPSLTTPPVMNSGGSTYSEPWLDGTETQEERIAILNKHIGDLYYDKATGHGYRFMYDSDNSAYVWTILTDEDVTEALALAAQAQATADGKSTTFLNNTSDQDETKRYPKNYKKGDTWILQVDATINGVAYKAGDILTTSADSTTYNAAHWSKQVRYTDDTYAHNFDYLKAAMKGDTKIQGGLLLSNAVVLRNVEQGVSTDIMSGINGVLNTDLVNPLKSIAAWYGGDMLDREAASDSSSSSSEEEEEPRYAKSLLRFDGSGYLASGNITWDATGRVTIKDLHTDDGGTPTDILQEMSAFRGMFDLSVWESATRIKPLQNFEQLKITRPSGYTITDSDVVTYGEMKGNFITKDWFNQILKLHYKENASAADAVLSPNNMLPSGAVDVSLESVFSFWTNYAISALGQGVDGSHAIGSLDDLSDVELTNPATDQILKFDGTHWVNAAAPQTYVLPQATSGALGGIKIGYNDATPKTYAVALNSAGQAYVAVPWPDHYAWGDISNKPTTISGYGITDAYTKAQVDSLARLKSVALASDGVLAFELQDGSVSYADLTHQHDFQEILDKPTTLAGFGITDAKIESGVITLGGNTITPVTSVAMTVPDGFSVSGSPISKTGTLALTYTTDSTGKTMKQKIDALYSWFEVDSNGDIKTKDYQDGSTTKHRGFWSPSFISALGEGNDGGGGGQGDVTWELLKQADTRPINISHLTGALSGYATQSWVTSQGYVTTSGMNTAINALTYLNSVSLNNDGSVVFGGHGIENTILDLSHQHSFLELLDRPTTIAGYGIVDAITTDNIGSQSVAYATSAGDASTLGGTAKGGLFTSLSSASDTKLSITIGGTTKTLSTLYASYAAQLTSAVNLYIADSDATNTGAAVSFSGASNVTLKLPSTIKATLSGNATTATTATKLSTVSKTAWGRTYWTANGVPDSISGALESVTNITMSGYIKIGSIYIGEDSNGDLEIYKLSNGSHVAANLYARGGVSALGQSSSGGGGGGQGDVTWDLLKSSDTRQINISHLAGDANYAGVMSILTGYTTSGKNYKVQEDSNHHLYVNVPWTDNNTTYTNGTGLSLSGTTFSINSTYQTYISNGNTAYGWGNHASAGYALQTSLNALEYFNSITGGSDIITITTNKSNSTVIDLTHQHSFQELTDKPTTIAGYGITDVYSWARQSTKPSYAFSEITGTATANQIPSIQNINSFGTYVYSAQISRTANTVLAAPNGSAGVASFRSLVAADIPSLDWSKIGSGKPTTLSGYGITDACTQSTANRLLYTMSLNNDGTINVITLGGTTKYSIDFTHQHSFFELVDRPTTIDGYSITGGKFVDDITFVNTKGVNMLNTANAAKKVMYLSSGNVLVIGSGTSESSYNTYLRGYNVYLKFGTTGATGLILNSSGNVGIGTSSPSSKLHVDGDIYATGGVTALVATSSDIRKKNVVSYDLPLTLNQIADAPTIKFTWKDNAQLGEQVGSIAQYWQKVLPQTIRTEKDDTLSLQYGVAALVAAITTARKVVDHEKEIAQLKERVSALEKENELLKLKIA